MTEDGYIWKLNIYTALMVLRFYRFGENEWPHCLFLPNEAFLESWFSKAAVKVLVVYEIAKVIFELGFCFFPCYTLFDLCFMLDV